MRELIGYNTHSSCLTQHSFHFFFGKITESVWLAICPTQRLHYPVLLAANVTKFWSTIFKKKCNMRSMLYYWNVVLLESYIRRYEQYLLIHYMLMYLWHTV